MIRWTQSLAAGLMKACALACMLSANAADKVELRGSTSIELPKPDRKFEETTRFKFESGASDLDGGFAPPQNIGSTGPLDRKLREMLDRKKNWIFVNPYEMQFDERTSDILGKNKSASKLLDHHLLQDDEKTAMQRFLEEKESRRSNENSSQDSPNRDEKDMNSPSSRQGQELADEDRKLERNEKNSVQFLTERGGQEFKPRGFDSADFEKRMERTPLDGSIFTQSRIQRPEVDKEEIKRQQDAREADFEKIIAPRGLAGASVGSLAGHLDPLSTASDSTRQEANPAAGRRTDQFLSPNRVDFSGGRSGGLSASLPGSSFDFGGSSRNSQPTYLPSVAPPASTPAPGFAPSPFRLEFPRRNF